MNDEREIKMGFPVSVTAIVTNITNIGLHSDVPTLQDEDALAKRITLQAQSGDYEIDLDPDFAKDIRIGDKLILNHLDLIDKKILMPNESSVIAKALVNSKEEPAVKARLLASRVKHVFDLAAANHGLRPKIFEISVRHDVKTNGHAIGIYTQSLSFSFLIELRFQLSVRFPPATANNLIIMGSCEMEPAVLNEELTERNIISIWFMIDNYNPDKSEKLTFAFDEKLNAIE